MSSSPKYSTVTISAERQRELDQQRAAQRRRQEEEERRRQEEIYRRIEAERKERLERIERRRAEIEQRRQARAAAAQQRIEASRADCEERLGDTEELRDMASHREAQPDRRARTHAHEEQADHLGAEDALSGDGLRSPPDARISAALEALGKRSAGSLAQAEVLLAEGANHGGLAGRLEVVARARSAVERALVSDDEQLLADAARRLDAELDAARRAHAALLEQQARRHTIARGVARALPDRYVVHADEFTERHDGSIHFVAYALDQELHLAIVGDGAHGEVIACEAEDGSFETRVESGIEVADCPGLAAELDETNARLRQDGFEPAMWTWPGAPGKRELYTDTGGELGEERVKPKSTTQNRSKDR